MNNKLKKFLCAALSASMVAGSVILPMAASAEETVWSADAGVWKFDFGASENVAEGYIGVNADTQYDATKGYGLLGLENGYATDGFVDGFTMTQGYDLTLENGARDTVLAADDDFVACTYDETIGNTGMLSPIRFAMKSPESTYYKVKVTLQRADKTKDAKVNLYTERRHQHLIDESIPEEGLVYECSVFVHNWHDKNSGEKHDNMLNVVALGENVAISSIEVEQTEQGKTLFVLTDSTGCEQTTGIPYFPLDHCQGVGSAMAKYLGKDWAIVNEGQSGLSASAAKNHFENCINDVQEGDVVWFQFGHNDDKISGDPATNGYLSSLKNYYDQVSAKKANFVVVGPIDRDTVGQTNAEGTWSSTLSHYSTAGKSFVDEQIAAGKTNIAFVDLNAPTIEFLDEVTAEIKNAGYHYGSQEKPDASNPRFYYYVSTTKKDDYTHPNDYGADNFAHMFVEGANEIIAADANSVQAKVLAPLMEGQRGGAAVRVPESIYSLGAAPNSAYPNPLVQVVYYKMPWLISKVTFDENGYFDKLYGKTVACKDISSVYGRGIVEVYDKDGQLKGTVTTKSSGGTEFFDSSILTDQSIDFAKATDTVKYDAEAGDTYKVFVTNIDQGTNEDTDTVVSNTLTEKDNYDVNKYLIQGSTGQENIEDFSTYASVAVGDTLIGTNGWSSAGSATMVLGEENGLKYASVKNGDGSSHYVYKSLTEPVSEGQVLVSMDVRYHGGIINFEFTDGSKAPNSFPPLILPIVVKTVDSKAGVYLDGQLVSEINTDEWINIQYVIDLDYGTHTAKVNGQEVTCDIAAMQGNTANSPSKLAAIGLVETTKSLSVDYDITNLTIASLNVPELPDRTIKAKAISSEGTVEVLDSEEAAETLPVTAKMNTFHTLRAIPEKGYKFVSWNDSKTDAVVSYNDVYKFRLHSDVDVYAEFVKTAEPDMVFNLEGNGTVDEYIVSSGSKTSGIWSLSTQGNYAFMTVADTAIKYLKLTGMPAGDGQFYLFTANDSGKTAEFTGKNSDASVDGAGVYKFSMAPVKDYSNEGTKHRGTDDVSVALCNNEGAAALTVAYTASNFTLAVNGETVHTFADATAAQKWTDVKAILNADHTKATVTLTYSDGSEPTVKEVDLAAANSYNTLKVNTTKWGTVVLDNIQLYEGDEYIPSDALDLSMTYIPEDGKIKISSNKELQADLYVASYDKTTKTLSKIDKKTLSIKEGAMRVGVDTAEDCDLKLMLWQKGTMVPIISETDIPATVTE